jgi:hypothetical protein
MEKKDFPSDYFTITAEGGTYANQAGTQIMCLLITLVISIVGGAISGWLSSFDIWHPAHALFRDDDHFYDMLHKYPKSYLKHTDEHYSETKDTIIQIKEFL